jgi:hypothetical protein
MPQNREIISLTKIDAELFTNDEGEFPTFITLITSSTPTDIVTLVLERMSDLFTEQFNEGMDNFGVALQSAETIRDRDENTHTIITPETLAMILDYDQCQRLIILELGTSPNDFTIH